VNGINKAINAVPTQHHCAAPRHWRGDPDRDVQDDVQDGDLAVTIDGDTVK
jgi:hypothetical protein